MTFLEAQQRFMQMLGKLIDWCYLNGYQLTAGEAYRTPEQAEWNEAHGKGIKNTLHTQRLAIDLHLFKGRQYLTEVEDVLPMGEFWETMGGSWGGRFDKPDTDHFSLAWKGVR